MRFFTQSPRRTIIIFLVSLLAIGGTWWGLWELAVSGFRAAIDGWINSGRASGYVITYDSRDIFGFPQRVVLRFRNLNWKNTDGIAFHADQMDVSSLPWDREAFDAWFRGHVELAAPLDADGRALTLGGEDGRAHVVLDADGIWKFSRVSLQHARLGRAPDVLFLADRLEATAQRPDHTPKDHTEPGLTLTGNAENVTVPDSVPTPFGPKMAALEASLRVMGDMPDFRKKDSVVAWNDGSGIVEFDSLHMDWGPLRMMAKGTIGFDDDLQPEGAFAGEIGNHEDVLQALMAHDFIAKRQEAMLNSALALFAKPAGAKSDIEVPITIQLGGLFLGPVRIFVFPEINWPKNPVPAAIPAPSPVAN